MALRVRELVGEGSLESWPDELAAPLEPLGRSGATGPSRWQRWAARVPVRLDPGRRGAMAVGLAVLLAAVVTGVWLMSSRPRAVPVSARVPGILHTSPLVGTGAPAPAPVGAPSSSAPAVVVVDVAGKVRRPGVYRLATGSRVDDAVRAAGGPRGRVDLSSLNLAAKITDGQQIVVGQPASAAVQPAPAGGSGAADPAAGVSGAAVDLNTASLDQLETLPGVGPVLGQHILDYRTAHGSFTSVSQLQDVSGIGDVKFAALQPLVSL